VCKGSECRAGGSEALFTRARAAIEQGPLASRCEVVRGGCYGLCHLGPNVVVRVDSGAARDPLSRETYELLRTPGETYYWDMTIERLTRVIDEHLREHQIVRELVGDPDREPT
jgi:(2Fe-2S) ferredoxin